MNITVHPSDIIKRCLWNEYKRFCLVGKTDEQINEFIVEDKPFTILENDSYVIGLLKVVETDNLVHRFKIHIEDLLKVRSNLFDNKLYINRNVVLNEVKDFKNRFPDSFNPDFKYKLAIDELNEKLDETFEKLEECKIYTKILNDKTYNFVSSGDVKSLVNF